MKLTIKDIRDLEPCYDPSRYLKEKWEGSVQDILRMSNVPPQDRIWVCAREEFIDKDLLFKFAENCCWQIVDTLPEKDQIEYCNILHILRLARETNDNDLLGVAQDAAHDVAWNAAWGAAHDVAWDAAWDAAWGAAQDVAHDVAWDEFCLMLIDMINGIKFDDTNMYLLSRLKELKEEHINNLRLYNNTQLL